MTADACPDVRFTRRCLDEDLRRLPRRVVAAALDAAEALAKNPDLGDQLDPPLDRFRRLRIVGRFRLIYTREEGFAIRGVV